MDDETSGDDGLQPPARLRGLASWQANKASILGARLAARHMPLTARSDFAVLAALEEYGSLSQADLGRRLGLDRNDVSGIVARLENGGHIDRRADPDLSREDMVFGHWDWGVEVVERVATSPASSTMRE